MRPETLAYLRAVECDDLCAAWVGSAEQVEAEAAGLTEASADARCGSRLTELGRSAIREHEGG